MSSQLKLQTDRPNKFKPSVVKQYTYWWAQAWTPTGEFLTALHHSQQDALTTAYEYAELNREVTA